MTGTPAPFSGAVLFEDNGTERKIDLSPGEVLIGMTLAEMAAELAKLREAVVTFLSDPGNPYSSADRALALLSDDDNQPV